MNIKNIVFDFGGVLVDWNPRYMYREVFENEEKMEHFLAHICTDEWNVEQDRGRTLDEATRILQEQYPEQADLIAMYYDRWEEMLKGSIQGTVDILYELAERFPLYGLTNWSAETFPIALKKYPFFTQFQGIVVSGEVNLIKPDKEIFYLLCENFDLKPEECIFIDDNAKNIETAKALGFQAIHFSSPEQLKEQLEQWQIL